MTQIEIVIRPKSNLLVGGLCQVVELDSIRSSCFGGWRQHYGKRDGLSGSVVIEELKCCVERWRRGRDATNTKHKRTIYFNISMVNLGRKNNQKRES